MSLDAAAVHKIANTVRSLSLDAIDQANSGHPGLPLGAADIGAVVWAKFLNFNPADPAWPNRDRFVLSAGHGCMLWYSLLHLFGFDLPISELKRFRQWESKTPGHPEFGMTPGIETTTGPLGQGFGNGVGLALSAKMLGARYGNDLFNYRVYGIVSDGDVMEGVAAEAASLAGHLGLNNLIYLYDDNKISLAGETKICFTESVGDRMAALGWAVQSVDGHDPRAIEQAIALAQKEQHKPSFICCRTVLGWGSPNKRNTHEAHGAPLGAAETKLTKAALGIENDTPFFIPADVQKSCATLIAEKKKTYDAWIAKRNVLAPATRAALDAQLNRSLPANLKDTLIDALKEPKKDATRNISGKALNVIAKVVPNLVGGSADLDPSTKTALKDAGSVQAGEWSGRNIHFGVREHAMGALANGLAYTQCWFPYTATFLVFADYMRPTIRLAALSHLQTLFIFTHDSFWVGEDGPTHEPIEQVASLRLIPNLHVFRPADGIEVALAYYAALSRKDGPSSLIFTRQNVPPLNREGGAIDDALKGGYILSGTATTELVIVATGSEVGLAVDAAKLLAASNIKARIVSMPCMELFLKQPAEYRNSVIPPGAKKVSLEAGVTNGWERIVGSNGLLLGLDHYGASAPGEVLAEKFGFTPEAVAKKIAKWVQG